MTGERQRENLLAGRVLMAFASPIATYTWPASDALNAALREMILAREVAEPGMARSNVGGWHSKKDLLLWGGPNIATLLERMRIFASDMTALALNEAGRSQPQAFAIEAWANVSRDGCYNTVHHHASANWSGVYYVDPGTPNADVPRNGKLELLEPRAGIGMVPFEGSIFDNRYLIEPTPGLMVIFPGWLNHFVHPFRGTGERISIAFNVGLRPAGSR